MQPSCRNAREALAGGDASGLEAHVRECGECAAFATRHERQRRELARLERRRAPAELDGRVVAALEAGHRGERAAGAIRRLARVAVPARLDRAVARDAEPGGSRSLAAPDVLRRLVEEELADPSKARTRRFVGSLARLAVPAELAARVEGALGAPRPRRWFRSRLLVGSAALLLVAILVVTWSSLTRERAGAEIQWVRVDSASELSPLAASFVAGLSGGASELRFGRGAR